MHYHIAVSTLLIALAHAAPVLDVESTDLSSNATPDPNPNDQTRGILQETSVPSVRDSNNPDGQVAESLKPVEGEAYPAPKAFHCSDVPSAYYQTEHYCGYHNNENYWACDRGPRHTCFIGAGAKNVPEICAKTPEGLVCLRYTGSDDNTPIDPKDNPLFKNPEIKNPEIKKDNEGQSQNSPNIFLRLWCKFNNC